MKAFRWLVTIVALAFAASAFAQTRPNGFSVILLLGETQGSGSSDALPPAPGVRKALNDVKDFLPYKSYRVVDSQWMRSGSTRMKGPDDQEYEVEVTDVDQMIPSPVRPKPGVLRVAFKLQDAGAAQNSSEEFGRSIQAAELEKQLQHDRALLPNAQGPMAEEQKTRIERLQKQLRLVRAKKLIDSQFEMEIGETVVVGTSKIGGGDKGLVVLLTSVAAGR